MVEAHVRVQARTCAVARPQNENVCQVLFPNDQDRNERIGQGGDRPRGPFQPTAKFSSGTAGRFGLSREINIPRTWGGGRSRPGTVLSVLG